MTNGNFGFSLFERNFEFVEVRPPARILHLAQVSVFIKNNFMDEPTETCGLVVWSSKCCKHKDFSKEIAIAVNQKVFCSPYGLSLGLDKIEPGRLFWVEEFHDVKNNWYERSIFDVMVIGVDLNQHTTRPWLETSKTFFEINGINKRPFTKEQMEHGLKETWAGMGFIE